MTPINSSPRYDMYMAIHKAMRSCMHEALAALGRMDINDADEVAAALAQLRELLNLCDQHVQKENKFVHAAMEQRKPGSSAEISAEHIEHEHDIGRLRAAVKHFEVTDVSQRAAFAQTLYRDVALFVAHNFEHMHYEEIEHNTVLWSVYSDAELIDIENNLKASISPQDMAITARWMLTANDHAFRVAMLSDVRAHAPVEVFEMLLGIARANLSERDWRKVTQALELPRAA